MPRSLIDFALSFLGAAWVLVLCTYCPRPGRAKPAQSQAAKTIGQKVIDSLLSPPPSTCSLPGPGMPRKPCHSGLCFVSPSSLA